MRVDAARAIALTVGLSLCTVVGGGTGHPPVHAAGGQDRSPPAGTAAVSGVVVTEVGTTQPVRRAVVTLSRVQESTAGELNWSDITNDAGRFTILALPVGRYLIRVTKPAFLPAVYGAKRPDESGVPVVLRPGDVVSEIRIALVRGGVIAGTIRDENGEPCHDVRVSAIRVEQDLTTGSSNPSRVASVTTDDRGYYRMFGLPPGEYLVGAVPRAARPAEIVLLSRGGIDAVLRALQQGTGRSVTALVSSTPASPSRPVHYAPVYYPAALLRERAATIGLAAGEERDGIDITLQLVATANIEGVVIGIDGRPTGDVTLEVLQGRELLPVGWSRGPSMAAFSRVDGTFRYTNVAPGTYTLRARSAAQVINTTASGDAVIRRLTPAPFHWGLTTVVAQGEDVTGVRIDLRPALTMTGRIAFDSDRQPPPRDLTRVRLTLSRIGNSAGDPAPQETADGVVRADGSFEISGLTHGRYELRARVPDDAATAGWWLCSAVMNGRDLLDGPLELVDRDLTDVIVSFSDRRTEIAGILQTPEGQPAQDYVVFALPADRALWTADRRLRMTRPDTDGRFAFADLPPGTYLLAVSTGFADSDWRTHGFLEAMAAAGVTVLLGEGERKLQNLTIAARDELR